MTLGVQTCTRGDPKIQEQLISALNLLGISSGPQRMKKIGIREFGSLLVSLSTLSCFGLLIETGYLSEQDSVAGGIKINTECALCLEGQETRDHLFLHCSFS